MFADDFRKIIAKIDSLDVNDDLGYEECWKAETALLTNDINVTIKFLKTECSADEFSWMSEVFEDVVEVTKSMEFLKCIEDTAKRFPDECSKYNIAGAIESAKACL